MTHRLAERRCRLGGTWYPETAEEIETYWVPEADRVKAKAVVCPHAGWAYSGHVAAEVYGKIQPADTFIVLGPNHFGEGEADTSLWMEGTWELPNGRIEMDEPLAHEILDHAACLVIDPAAHKREHSIEVQVPFLLLLNPKAKLVPILMRNYAPEVCRNLGSVIAEAVRSTTDRTVLLVASTDLTHYEPNETAFSKDQAAIERMAALDVAGLYTVVDQLDISMCGLGPVAAVLTAARQLGASAGRMVRYATSGDITGDNTSVVGYAGLVIA